MQCVCGVAKRSTCTRARGTSPATSGAPPESRGPRSTWPGLGATTSTGSCALPSAAEAPMGRGFCWQPGPCAAVGSAGGQVCWGGGVRGAHRQEAGARWSVEGRVSAAALQRAWHAHLHLVVDVRGRAVEAQPQLQVLFNISGLVGRKARGAHERSGARCAQVVEPVACVQEGRAGRGLVGRACTRAARANAHVVGGPEPQQAATPTCPVAPAVSAWQHQRASGRRG